MRDVHSSGTVSGEMTNTCTYTSSSKWQDPIAWTRTNGEWIGMSMKRQGYQGVEIDYHFNGIKQNSLPMKEAKELLKNLPFASTLLHTVNTALIIKM